MELWLEIEGPRKKSDTLLWRDINTWLCALSRRPFDCSSFRGLGRLSCPVERSITTGDLLKRDEIVRVNPFFFFLARGCGETSREDSLSLRSPAKIRRKRVAEELVFLFRLGLPSPFASVTAERFRVKACFGRGEASSVLEREAASSEWKRSLRGEGVRFDSVELSERFLMVLPVTSAGVGNPRWGATPLGETFTFGCAL